MAVHFISDKQLTLRELSAILSGNVSVQLSEEATRRIIRCREYLDEKLAGTGQAIYGINTGFGSLYNRHIAVDQLEKLQENLVKSHACGTGPEVPKEIVKLMLFLKVQSLAYG
jgi:histidine ammonia-lyase